MFETFVLFYCFVYILNVCMLGTIASGPYIQLKIIGSGPELSHMSKALLLFGTNNELLSS